MWDFRGDRRTRSECLPPESQPDIVDSTRSSAFLSGDSRQQRSKKASVKSELGMLEEDNGRSWGGSTNVSEVTHEHEMARAVGLLAVTETYSSQMREVRRRGWK